MKDQLQSLAIELGRFAKRQYPPFVASPGLKELRPGELPVFIFHTVQEDRFGEQMKYLHDNGYGTLTADEVHAHVTGAKPAPAKSVVVTFDDGEKSLHRVALPVLDKYGLRAIAFIVPHFMTDTVQPATDRKQWISWPELKEIHASGVIDIQSHTLRHERMFVGREVTDFVRPGLFVDQLGVDNPIVRKGDTEEWLTELGAPVYELGPRMEEKPKFFDDESIRDACIAYVQANGGEAFFQRQSWRSELGVVLAAAREKGDAGSSESPAEQRAAIFDSLKRSRELIRERIGKDVRHVAYPWTRGSALSLQLSKDAGYITNFWGCLPDNRLNTPGTDPFRICRVKDDYIFRLPGTTRWSLADVFLMKSKRRLTQNDIY